MSSRLRDAAPAFGAGARSGAARPANSSSSTAVALAVSRRSCSTSARARSNSAASMLAERSDSNTTCVAAPGGGHGLPTAASTSRVSAARRSSKAKAMRGEPMFMRLTRGARPGCERVAAPVQPCPRPAAREPVAAAAAGSSAAWRRRAAATCAGDAVTASGTTRDESSPRSTLAVRPSSGSPSATSTRAATSNGRPGPDANPGAPMSSADSTIRGDPTRETISGVVPLVSSTTSPGRGGSSRPRVEAGRWSASRRCRSAAACDQKTRDASRAVGAPWCRTMRAAPLASGWPPQSMTTRGGLRLRRLQRRMRTHGAGHWRRAAGVHGDRQRRERRKVDPQCVVISQCVAGQQAGVEWRRLRCRQHELERCGAIRVQLDPAGPRGEKFPPAVPACAIPVRNRHSGREPARPSWTRPRAAGGHLSV